MTQGTTPQFDRRPGVGQAPEPCCEGRRYAPGHTLHLSKKGGNLMHEVGLIGGTFDRFHAGHLSLMEAGLSECSSIEAWLTADHLALSKDPRVNPWDTRTLEMKEALGDDAGRVRFHVLEDNHGPAPVHTDATAIICTEETRAECEEINRLRTSSDLSPLNIISVGHVLAWDGEPISSSRIRAGEIDRNGKSWIPNSIRTGRVVLTSQVEAELKEPFGQLIPGPEGNPSVAMAKVLTHLEGELGPVIAVGDVTVRTMQDLNRPADIALIDGLTRREPWEGADEIDSLLYDGVLQCSSPAGSLTPSLLEACERAMKSWKEGRLTHLIQVEGEEDLAPLILHPLAPLGAVVLYGQPGKGVVVRWCGEDAKQRCRRLLSEFIPAE